MKRGEPGVCGRCGETKEQAVRGLCAECLEALRAEFGLPAKPRKKAGKKKA